MKSKKNSFRILDGAANSHWFKEDMLRAEKPNLSKGGHDGTQEAGDVGLAKVGISFQLRTTLGFHSSFHGTRD
jgi:hypothetical protein